jgi:hypothetical protein
MKDPAVLFYTSDFISGTITMTDEQRGKYIILLCLQHQQEVLSYDDMINICKTYDDKIFKKFTKNESGCYYNERMKIESDRRKKYSESRSKNRGNICKTYDKHMGTENINEDINRDNSINVPFETFWNLYNKKVGAKNKCEKKWNRLTDADRQKIIDTLPDFISSIKDKQFQPYPETYLNQERWNDEIVKKQSTEDFEKEVWSKMKYGNKE